MAITFTECASPASGFISSVIRRVARKWASRAAPLITPSIIGMLNKHLAQKERFRNRPMTYQNPQQNDYYRRKISELQASEGYYLIGLESLKSMYIPMLMSHPKLPPRFKKVLKSLKIEKLIKFHNLFLRSLTKCHIIDTFINYGIYLTNYDNYIINYSYIQKTLLTLARKDSVFSSKIKSKRRDNLDLFSLLIMPIQRLPRYEILLIDLKKILVTEEEKRDIDLVIENIRNITSYINAAKKRNEEMERVLNISQSLFSDNRDLIIPKVFTQSQKMVCAETVRLSFKRNVALSSHYKVGKSCGCPIGDYLRIKQESAMASHYAGTPGETSKASSSQSQSASYASGAGSRFFRGDRLWGERGFLGLFGRRKLRKYEFYLFKNLLLWTKKKSYKLKGYLYLNEKEHFAVVLCKEQENLHGKGVRSMDKGLCMEEEAASVRRREERKGEEDTGTNDEKELHNRKDSISSSKDTESEDDLFYFTVYPPVVGVKKVSSVESVQIHFKNEEDKDEMYDMLNGCIEELKKQEGSRRIENENVVSKPVFKNLLREEGESIFYKNMDIIEDELKEITRD